MKVLVLGFCDGMGGGPTHFRLLTRFLVSEGHKVFAVGITNNARDLPPAPRNCEMHPFVYEAAGPLPKLFKALQFVRLAAGIRRFKPDLFVSIAYGRSYPAFARVAGRKCFKCYQDVWLAGRDPVRDAMAGAFDAAAVQSPMMVRIYREVMGTRKPVNWLPCFAEIVESEALATSPSSEEPLRLAYFGRLAGNKGLVLLVDAVARLPRSMSLSLAIFGQGPEERRLAELIERLHLKDRVRLCGPYPTGEAYVELLTQQHAVIIPSTFGEGLPLVLLEAMCRGLPILTTNVGAIPDATNGNPDAIMVDPDGDSVYLGLLALCGRLRLGEFHPKRQRKFYNDNFSAEIFKSRWRAMLADVKGYFANGF